jgi:hypothetical protein
MSCQRRTKATALPARCYNAAMAVRVHTGSSGTVRPTSTARPASLPRLRRSHVRGGAQLLEHHEDLEHQDPPALLALLAERVRRLNKLAVSDWSGDDYDEVEWLAELILRVTEQQADEQHKGNPFEQKNALNNARLQLRTLLQSLQPPDELIELFSLLWQKLRPVDISEQSSFVRRTIMNAKVRQDVMNRQVEVAVDEADEVASRRRVEAITRDGGRRQGQPESSDATSETPQPQAAAEAAAAAPAPTLKRALRQLRKKRREIGRDDAEQLSSMAFDIMRTLREEIAPRWAPETQPWLLNTADNHIYQSVLAVIPEALFRETNAFEGIQSLRAGEHAFGLRAAAQLGEAVGRTTPTKS